MTTATVLKTRIEEWDLDLIDDNPFNPRLFYKPAKVAEKAASIKEIGLLQKPKARILEGRVQLAFGGYRRRAYLKLRKDEPKKWLTMPLEIEEMTDDQMVIFALEENLKRDDNTPIEVARAIGGYFSFYPKTTETWMAKKLNLSQGHVSNMLRVLTLPDYVLEKIDEGRISFTMGRELLIFAGLEVGTYSEWSRKEEKNVVHKKDEAWLMKEAIRHIRTPDSADRMGIQENPTVEGMQKAIHGVAVSNLKQLDKEVPGHYYSYGSTPLFDSRDAGCLKCEKMILTRPTKSANAHYCTDEKCWEKHQKKHQTKVAAEAVAKRQADLQRIAAEEATKIEAEEEAQAQEESISQEIVSPSYKMEKRGTSWIALDSEGSVIAIDLSKGGAEAKAALSFKPVGTELDTRTQVYVLNHTYRIIPVTRTPGFLSDVTAQDAATAIEAAGLTADEVSEVKVWKSSGKLGTAGGVSAGWSKCTEPMEKPDPTAEIYKERDLVEGCKTHSYNKEGRCDFCGSPEVEEVPPEPDPYAEERLEEKVLKAKRIRNMDDGYPCKTCVKCMTCDGTGVEAADKGDTLVCTDKITKDQVDQKVEDSKTAVPAELSAALVKAGTRGQVVDLHGLWADNYGHENITGYVRIDGILDELENPDECVKNCTRGFHYAFDSSDRESQTYYICDDKKCVSQKKAAYTRARNAKNNAKKIAERAAFKTAVEATTELDIPRMKLILYAQMNGGHVDRYTSYSTNKQMPWLLKRLKIESTHDEGEKAIWKVVNKMSSQELSRLLVDFMLNMLTYQAQSSSFYGSDHGHTDYKIQTTEVLNWMDIGINIEKKEGR